MRKSKWWIGAGTCAVLALTVVGVQLAQAYPDRAGVQGTVWNDVDNDGFHDTDEDGVAGVEINFVCWADVNGDGTVDHDTEVVFTASTTTDADGAYVFDDLPYDTWCDITLGALPFGFEPGPACPPSVLFDPTINNWWAYADFCIRETSVDPGIACRFTGGGHDTDLNWDHTLEDGSMVRNGSKVPDNIDRYSFGGQVGASTVLPPQPSGEWTHSQHDGPTGSFTFHGGTSSAPDGSRIVDVRCTDPGWCEQARPAPAKQLDFDGIGTFKNIGKGKKSPTWELAGANVTAEGKGNKGFNGTYHWFEVNVDDLGEPGRANADPTDASICPPTGFGEKGSVELADCQCPDFYRITIYDGVDKATLDSNGPNQTDVLYEVYGYIDGGNLQIHPPTGNDLKAAKLQLSPTGRLPVSDGGRVRTGRRNKLSFGRVDADPNADGEPTRERTLKLRNTSRTESLVVSVGDALPPFTGGGGVFAIEPRSQLDLSFGFAPEEAGRFRQPVVIQTSDPKRRSIKLQLKGAAR